MENKNLKKCPHCGADMAKNAKICPKCGGKYPQPIYKKWWFWVIIVILVFGVYGSGGKSSDNSSADGNTPKQEQQEEQNIEYAEVTTDELSDALDKNAMNASDTYKGKYFAVTGRLSNIDSDGKYISLVDVNDEWSIRVIQCYIKNDEQLEKVKQMSIDDTVTVKGKITDVGELMGYSMDIDSIE